MKPETFAALVLVLLLVIAAGWYAYTNLAPLVPEQTAQPQVVPPSVEPQRLPVPPHNPVPPPRREPVVVEGNAPIPAFPKALPESDAFLNLRLPQLIESPKLLSLLLLDHFIDKLVLFIDQLPGKEVSRQHLPLKPPAAGFLTDGAEDALVISRRNAARYDLHLALLEAIPVKELLQLYRGLYPLFQQAYADIEPKGYFNDRLIQVIDHLLQTPEPVGKIPLVRHIRRFRYADEELEARSAGQKILLRMGVDNTRRVKTLLKELREGLIRQE